MTAFLFDIDGTLTPSRQPMSPDFQVWFEAFCHQFPVYFVTGGDYVKTLSQVGPDILRAVQRSYNCTGNSVWIQGLEVRCTNFDITAEQQRYLQEWLDASPYPHRFGTHFERRRGLVNFSVPGRDCPVNMRQDYYRWDLQCHEREILAQAFEKRYPHLQCQVAGETGVDIFKRGCDKSQVLLDFDEPVVFFGDCVYPGGNDWTIAQAIREREDGSHVHAVQSWQETWDILKTYAQRQAGLSKG